MNEGMSLVENLKTIYYKIWEGGEKTEYGKN